MLNFIYVNKFIAKYFQSSENIDYEHPSKNINPDSPNYRVMLEAIDYIDNMERELVNVVSSDKTKLFARYFNNDSDKTVILFHDVNHDPITQFCCHINYFFNEGYNVLVPYMRGHFLSKAKYHSYGYLESNDVASWVEWTNKRVGTNGSIFLVGLGVGANAICMYSAMDVPPNVKRLLLDSPFLSLKDFVDEIIESDNIKDEDGMKLDIYKSIEKNLGFNIVKSSCIIPIKKCKLPVYFSCLEREGSKVSIYTQTLAAFCPTTVDTLILPCSEFDSDQTYFANRVAYNKFLKKFVSEKGK